MYLGSRLASGRASGRGVLGLIPAMVVAIVSMPFLVGCLNEPSIDERVQQQIVVTKFDPAADFGAIKTFAVAESVTVFTVTAPGAGAAAPSSLDPAVADPMLQEIASQLSSRGFVQVARTDRPDAGVAVTVLNRVRVSGVTYGAWWGNGSAAPIYWGYSSSTLVAPFNYDTVAWQSGSVIIELDDLRAARAANDIASSPVAQVSSVAPPAPASVPVEWAALVHGVFGAVGTTLTVPPIDAIRQAFAQSPYLHAANH
jgi:hypothetical protein